MATIIKTAELTENSICGEQQYWTYNGLDCCITFEVFEEMPWGNETAAYASPAYDFSRAMQAPVLDMMLRGWCVDHGLRQELLDDVLIRMQKLRKICDQYCEALGHDSVFGPKAESSTKLINLLYHYLKLPPQYEIDKKKKQKKLSANREALEKLENYWIARPLCKAILKFRDLDGEKSVLSSTIDADGRMRASTNITGTETGRFSQSQNAFGTGRSLHNIEATLRRVYTSDPGKKLGNFDLEQAESRMVGFLAFIVSGRSGYLDACEAGDLHTTVARMVWPDLAWTGDQKQDKKVASQIFYREFTYRDLAKRGGHATNYLTTPRTMAKALKIEERICAAFQEAYFEAFPEIKEWHRSVALELQTKGFLITPLGRTRHFLGRRFDDATLREAIANVPQATISDIAKLGLYRVWKKAPELDCELLHENHDNIIIQYPEAKEKLIIPQVLQLMQTPITINNRTLIIPPAAKVGWIWAEADDLNRAGCPHPDALIEWTGEDKRTRQRPPRPPLSIYERVVI